jgi:hypothetical protein
MAEFMIMGSYTADGAKGLLKDGGSRRKSAVEQMVSNLELSPARAVSGPDPPRGRRWSGRRWRAWQISPSSGDRPSLRCGRHDAGLARLGPHDGLDQSRPPVCRLVPNTACGAPDTQSSSKV